MVLEFLQGQLEFYQKQLLKALEEQEQEENFQHKAYYAAQIIWYKKQIAKLKREIKKEKKILEEE